MARSYSFNLVTGKPCLLFTVTRPDGTIERVTTASGDITINDITWSKCAGLKALVRTSRNDGTPPTLGFQVQMGASSPFKFRDVDRGKYERANVLIEIASQINPVTRDFEFDGEIRGKIEYDPNGIALFDLMSRFAIPRDIFVPTFTLSCRYSFGDRLTCGRGENAPATFPYIFGGDLADDARNEAIGLGDRRRHRFGSDDTPEDYQNVYFEARVAGTTSGSAPSYSSTVGATFTDGGVTWEVMNALARYAQVASASNGIITLSALPDPRASDSTWLSQLRIRFATGEYAGRVFKGNKWVPDTFSFETFLPCPHVAVGDWLDIAPDCDKRHITCWHVHDNAENHGGFPLQLGAKYQAQQMALTAP